MYDLIEGTYAHRFNGNALDRNYTNHYLGGLGSITLKKSGEGYKIVGKQTAVAVAFAQVAAASGKDPEQVKDRQFSLDGAAEWSAARNLWTAKVKFVRTDPGQPIEMEGNYVLTETGTPGHYWFMSIGQRILNGKVIAAEGASGEARLISRKSV